MTGHYNGKLLKWKILYKEQSDNNNKNKLKKIHEIKIEKEYLAHDCMISAINYNEKHNIILTADIKGILYVRKYYNFEFINKIVVNRNNFCCINKIFVTDYDIIGTVSYNPYKKKNYICLYSINGILLEKSNDIICIDHTILKNGKIMFNCLNEYNFSIFGFNG